MLEAEIRALRRQRQHGRGVGSRSLEQDEAEVDEPGDPELHVQRDAGDDVDRRIDEQRREVEGHPAAAIAPNLASSPCGRSTITSTSTLNATTALYSGEMTAALSSVSSPMITAPSIAP